MVDVAQAIEPGSTAYGDRQTLEAGLSSAMPQTGGGQPAPAGGGPLNIPEDPIGGLLSGEVSGDPNLPTTDGLSVGPGQGGPQDLNPAMQTPRAQRVRDLALNATSPAIRQAARNELRRTLREPL